MQVQIKGFMKAPNSCLIKCKKTAAPLNIHHSGCWFSITEGLRYLAAAFFFFVWLSLTYSGSCERSKVTTTTTGRQPVNPSEKLHENCPSAPLVWVTQRVNHVCYFGYRMKIKSLFSLLSSPHSSSSSPHQLLLCWSREGVGVGQTGWGDICGASQT